MQTTRALLAANSDQPRPDRRVADQGRNRRSGLGADLGRGWDLVTELLAAMLTWGGIGWLVDRWLATPPWFLVSGLLLGTGCGIFLVAYRAAEQERRDREAAARAEEQRP